VDTWWQTETGAIMISPLPGATPLKPGSATQPFFGVKPVILDDKGNKVEMNKIGNLCITAPWPALMRGVFGEPERFKETYFSQIPGVYFTGDQASIDENGDYWILGRSDDVIKVSGHRIGSAEVESVLVAHPAVAEAAIVAVPHKIKGQALYAFIMLNSGIKWTENLQQELITQIDSELGKIARPDYFQVAPELPKTRSGKIMRRILRKIAEGEADDLGDISTLADPDIVKKLVADRKSLDTHTG
jgi:acetyl-CoA synthetase